MSHIEHVDELHDRNSTFDAEVNGLLVHQREKHEHGDCIPIDHIYPRVYNGGISNGEHCHADGCDSPIILSYDLSTDMQVPCCKDCIVALKLASGVHILNSREICLDCCTRISPQGYPMNVYHQTMPLYAEPYSDVRGFTFPGIIQLVADHMVEIDPISGVVWKAEPMPDPDSLVLRNFLTGQPEYYTANLPWPQNFIMEPIKTKRIGPHAGTYNHRKLFKKLGVEVNGTPVNEDGCGGIPDLICPSQRT